MWCRYGVFMLLFSKLLWNFFFFNVNFASVITFYLNNAILFRYFLTTLDKRAIKMLVSFSFLAEKWNVFHFNPLSGSTKQKRKLNFLSCHLSPVDLVPIWKRNNLELDMKRKKINALGKFFASKLHKLRVQVPCKPSTVKGQTWFNQPSAMSRTANTEAH